MRFAVSLLVSLLALSSSASASSVQSEAESLSTVNRAGGWGDVSLSLEAGRFEDSHSHAWGAKAAVAEGGAKPAHFTYDPYDLEAGPSKWAENFPTSQCAGRSQSPAPLPVYVEAKPDPFLQQLVPTYGDFPMNTLMLRNTGHALQIDIPNGLWLQGGALGKNPYQVVQLHMHARSEHSVGGAHYPMEIHIVHRDFTRDINTDPRALAVLGIMVGESPTGQANIPLEALTSLLPNFNTQFQFMGGNATINKMFSLNQLLPWTNMDYYHYNGSLTTPPCSEQVVWHVLTTPIWASRDQILKLTAPFGTVGNSRPTQQLNGRNVAVTAFQTPNPFVNNNNNNPNNPNTINKNNKNDASTTWAMTWTSALLMISALMKNMQ